MITDWSGIAEPVPDTDFQVPSFATDLEFSSPLTGVVFVTPDGTALYRMFVDIDGAPSTEPAGFFSGAIPATSPPDRSGTLPTFGQVLGDLLILSPGSGILFPNGMGQITRSWSRLRIDNDGALGTEPDSIDYWYQIPETALPAAIDPFKNWVYTTDILMATPGQGLVMPVRGGLTTRRIRLDFDGAIVSE